MTRLPNIVKHILIRSNFNVSSRLKTTFSQPTRPQTVNGKYFHMKEKNLKFYNETPPPSKHWEESLQSLKDKGYLRNQRSYNPPADVNMKILSITEAVCGRSTEVDFNTLGLKYKILEKCAAEFDHKVPNSLIHKINNLDELLHFYNTEISTLTPLDNMKNVELPENLHIQYEYNRFHPETDTLYGGVSAFPFDSTVVTGLKTRKKYSGNTVESIWHYKTRKNV